MAYPTQREVTAIYAKRDAAVSGLIARRRVTAADVAQLDRLGRCEVADKGWKFCTLDARQSLLGDAHAHVRSCARIASAA